MSSTLNLSALLATVSAMEKELASLKAQISGSKGAPVAVKERKPRKKSDAPPSAWLVFTARVRDLLRSVKDGEDKEVYTGKALGVECQQFCSTLKDENADFASWVDADILARRVAWSAPEVSKQEAAGLHWKNGKKVVSPTGSAAASVVSDGEAPAASADKPKKERKNPWAGLSTEDRAAKVAAMKAGRAAKKAAVSAESGDAASGTESVLPPLPPSPSSVASKPAAVAVAVAVPAVSSGFRKVTLNNKAYLIDLASGHSYYRNADDSQGDWAGLFSKTPKPHINFDAPEPSAEDDGDFSLDA